MTGWKWGMVSLQLKKEGHFWLKLWSAQPYVLHLGWWKHLLTNHLGDTYPQETSLTCTASTQQPVMQQANHQPVAPVSLELCGRVGGGKNSVTEGNPHMPNATSVTFWKTGLEKPLVFKTMHVQPMHTSGIWPALLQIERHIGKCATELHKGKTFWFASKIPWTKANFDCQDTLVELYQKPWNKRSDQSAK